MTTMFQVRPRKQFPLIMLSLSKCWPATLVDAYLIHVSVASPDLWVGANITLTSEITPDPIVWDRHNCPVTLVGEV